MKQKTLLQTLTTLALLFLCQISFSQAIVSLSPAFPTENEAVTITFDASQGNAGLAGLPSGQQVYAHIGALINNGTSWQFVVGNWGTADNRVLMTRVGNSDIYTISLNPSIRQWFQTNNNGSATIPAGSTITGMAMVFRNANGSREGKTASNGDIFVQIASPGMFAAAITSHPQQNSLLINETASVTFTGQSSSNATLTFFLNSNVVATASSNIVTFNATTANMPAGLNTLVFSANDGGTEIRDTILVTRHSTPLTQSVPSGREEGIFYPNENSAYLQVRAPGKDFIYVLGDFNDWSYRPEYQLRKTPDGQFFWIEIEGLTPGVEYRFQYHIDWQGIRVTDAYVEKVVDPWNDQWIPASVYPNPTPYPVGKAQGIVGILNTRPEQYVWDNSYTYTAPPQSDLIIYELLVRDFTTQRSFKSVIERLPYLKSLGINAIEFMPVQEFEGNESWGYNPSFFFAVDKYYGGKNAFKELVDSCHKNGIAVIVDAVYNHAFGQCPLVQMYFDPNFGSYGQTSADNPWFNQVPRHDFNVGFDFNHESPATRYFVKKAINFWLEEFKIDGYRFDLSKGFTQVNSLGNQALWNQFDQSRVNIWMDYTQHMRSFKPDVYIILEHFSDWSEENFYTNQGLMVWVDGNPRYNQATMGWSDNQNLWGITHQARGITNYGLVQYMESHDEERLMYRNLQFGNSTAGHNVRQLNTALSRIPAAAAFFLTLPGPKMIWQFGELGYDFSINHCPNGTINPDCRTANKPVRWDYYNMPARRNIFEAFRKLAYLKTNFPLFRDLNPFWDLGTFRKTIRYQSPSLSAVIIGNFDVVAQDITPNFPFGGTWWDYMTGQSMNVTNTGMTMNLGPGEYRVFLNQNIVPPANTYTTPEGVGMSELEDAKEILVYPNPFSNLVTFYGNNIRSNNATIMIYDISGRSVFNQSGLNLNGPNGITIELPELKNGVYIYNIIVDGVNTKGKIIKS
jgi:1,4-alpha-glucan branching enzyme